VCTPFAHVRAECGLDRWRPPFPFTHWKDIGEFLLKKKFRVSGFTVLVAAIVTCSSATAAESPGPDWIIEGQDINPETYHGVSVANGMIGILSSPKVFDTEYTMINGAYEIPAVGEVSNMLTTFDFLKVSLSLNGEPVVNGPRIRQFRQSLNMHDAVLTTSFDFGDVATVTYRVRALRHLPFSALKEISIRARQPVLLAVNSSLNAPESEKRMETLSRSIATDGEEKRVDVFAAQAFGSSGTIKSAAAQMFLFEEGITTGPPVVSSPAGLSFKKQLPAGAQYSFFVVGSTITSAHVLDPFNEAQRLTVFAHMQGPRKLISEHESSWADLWRSDIVIEGDDLAQRDVRSMIYHLYSFVRENSGYTIAPMGLSGSKAGYDGHIFWDAEFWMLPPLLALKPELAKSMLDYRYNRLAAARRNASAHGYRGAMFPWESAATGEEDTTVLALTGPLEHLVTGCVGAAAWNYYRVTHDQKWLQETGYSLIKDTADFWVSRVSRNGPGRYDIENVVGADEYAENVNNDAFTNAIAKANLAAATSAANALGVAPNKDWEHVRQNIPILRFPSGITREHATYNSELIKQADVILLAYPLVEVTDPKRILQDLEHYEPRTDHDDGPAMTKSIMSILYGRLGFPDKAYDLFLAGYQPNQRPPFGVLAESANGSNPYFATAAGGLLQSLIYGFGGLKITDDGLVQVPSKLPRRWRSVTLKGIGPDARNYVVK
jgi:trehalose/maltose hydrolase-like predicted phosphorylase